MKNSVLLKTLGLTLVAGVTVSSLGIPAKTVSADADKGINVGDYSINLDESRPHEANELLISTKGVDLTVDASSLGFAYSSIEKVDISFDDNLYLVKTDPNVKTVSVAETFDADTFNYIEYNYINELIKPVTPYAGTGLEVPGWQHKYLDSQSAWTTLSKTTHSKVRVAIIDQGVDYTHPELEGLVNKNLSYDCQRDKKLGSDGFGDHGTHVAGIIGGRYSGSSDVNRGVASGAKNDVVEMVSVNIFPSSGGASDLVCAKGITYAADKNCRVANMSFGGNGYSNTMGGAVRYAYMVKGMCLIAAAGNESSDISSFPSDYPEVFSVMASDAYADPTLYKGASYSNYGYAKDVIAPGSVINSSVVGGGFAEKSGTSMASPCVTGVAAMMISVNTKITPAQIKTLIKKTCLDLYNKGYDPYTGYGMVDAGEAVVAAKKLKASSDISSFITRSYEAALDRVPDDATVEYWVGKLSEGATGADYINSICNAPEIESLNYNDRAFVNMLYNAIFNRVADKDGMSTWVAYLEAGCSRKSLVAQFINSAEFEALCDSYGIEAGKADFDKESERNLKVTAFVNRLYGICLNRASEEDGLEFWCEKINNGEFSAQQIVSFFFTSPEYTALSRNDEAFLNDLYSAFFDREADAAGFAFWAEQLANGTARADILSGFIYSEEFSALCASYGVRQF